LEEKKKLQIQKEQQKKKALINFSVLRGKKDANKTPVLLLIHWGRRLCEVPKILLLYFKSMQFTFPQFTVKSYEDMHDLQ